MTPSLAVRLSAGVFKVQTLASGEPVTLSASVTGLLGDQAIKEGTTGLLLGQRKGEDRASC